jgi:nucleoside-diphosphate-sugar epimerase
MPSIIVLGASSFIAKELMGAGPYKLPIKAVSRRMPADWAFDKEVEWLLGDLLDPSFLDVVFSEGDLVINLLYMRGAVGDQNHQLLRNLVQACVKAKVARLVHCSTAVVVGATKVPSVTELTRCLPSTDYEITKYRLEEFLMLQSHDGLDVGILRPTAVVGVGGKNLVKLSGQLTNSSQIMNYFRSSVYGNRPMHLVPVQMVAEALLHLTFLPNRLAKEVYIVAADFDSDNTFQTVERLLREALGIKQRWFPLFPFPRMLLRLLLRFFGRTDFSLTRKYSADKLKSTGFETSTSVGKAVLIFGASIKDYKLKD